jgi:hypothetical protein
MTLPCGSSGNALVREAQMPEENYGKDAFDKVAAVAVLNDELERLVATAGNSAQSLLRVGPYKTGALIFASATGKSTFSGPGVMNAGIILTILVHGTNKAQDDSFEGESASITFHAAASYIFFLAPDQRADIEARVDPYGGGGTHNKDTSVTLNVVAVAAQKK